MCDLEARVRATSETVVDDTEFQHQRHRTRLVRKVKESYIVSRIHYLLEHSTVRQTPCLPSCKGTVSDVIYECTQFTSRHHLLYSNLIPQHPVPLVSISPNHSHQHPQHPRVSSVVSFSPHLKDCPLYSRKLFCFSIFFIDP